MFSTASSKLNALSSRACLGPANPKMTKIFPFFKRTRTSNTGSTDCEFPCTWLFCCLDHFWPDRNVPWKSILCYKSQLFWQKNVSFPLRNGCIVSKIWRINEESTCFWMCKASKRVHCSWLFQTSIRVHCKMLIKCFSGPNTLTYLLEKKSCICQFLPCLHATPQKKGCIPIFPKRLDYLNLLRKRSVLIMPYV